MYGDASQFGKQIGGDILCNKKTYLLISAWNAADEKEKNELLYWMDVHNQPEKKIEAVTECYNRLRVKDKARNLMEDYYGTAIHALEEVNVPAEKKLILDHLAKELMNRKS